MEFQEPGFKILVIDDEAVQREMVGGFLKKRGLEVTAAESASRGLKLFEGGRYDLVLTDHRMPGMTGLDLLREVKRLNPEVEVIIFTAYGTIETAVAAMKEGAYDYLTKPIDLDELLILVNKVRERRQLLAENRELKELLKERYQFDQIVAESGAMQEVLSMVGRVAGSDATVLIRGESGTGKELIARAIHYNSARAQHPLVRVNCAALPENLLESELFGHERGAFTGAVKERVGRFEAAHGGTIFLDEIGDLSPMLQVKLLRFLQEKEYERVGSSRTVKVDARVLAATNRDLEEGLRSGRFREDLYYRLNVVPIFIPPLRERRQDIPPLIDHFLEKFSRENKKATASLSAEARDVLMKYSYPGNVRELENIIARAVVLARGTVLSLDDLPVHLRQAAPPSGVGEPATLPEAVESVERQMIARALNNNDWVQTRAAQELGISERVLRYKMKKYGLVQQG